MSHVSHCQVCDEGAYPEDNGCWCGLCHRRAMEAQRARLLKAVEAVFEEAWGDEETLTRTHAEVLAVFDAVPW